MGRRVLWLAAIATAASALLVGSSRATANGAAAQAAPSNVTCHSGQVITGFYGTVTVPAGNYCELLQAVVEGNVNANGAKQLGIDNSTVTGNINASGITDNGWICGSRIGGSVTVNTAASNPGTSTSPGYWDIGFADPSYCGSTGFDPVPGNSIMGTLTFEHNKSGGKITNDDIEGRLICGYNSPVPTGSNNQIDGTQAACGQVTTGTDNDTSSPGDND